MVGLFQNIVRRAPGVIKNLSKQGTTRASTLLDDFMRQQFASAGRRVGPSVRAQANKPGLPGLIGEARVAAATPLMRGTTGAVGGSMGIQLANESGLTGNIQNALNQVGPGLDRFFGAVTPEPIQEFGREMQQYGWGALGGFVPGELRGGAPGGERQIGLRNFGPGYKESELAAGAAAEAFRPGAGFPGQQVRGGSADDRAYEQERSRVAQLTAQDPELQRYENARKAAQTQEEMNAVRDMGMEMWQSKYGSTPMGQPGGAIGTFNPLMQSTFGYQTGGAPGQLQAPLSPDVQTVMGDLGTRAMADTGYDPAAYGITPEMIEQIKKQSLERARK